MSEDPYNPDQPPNTGQLARLLPSMCGPQESKSYFTGAYVEVGDNAQLLGQTESDGLIPLGGFPPELRGSVPDHWMPAFRPIVAAFSYRALTGPAHQVDVSIIGRRLGNPPGGVPDIFWRHTVTIHALDPLVLVRNVFAFNLPIPVDTEAGNGHPYSIRILTVGKAGVSIATVNYQWGLLDLSSRTHGGSSG